MEEMKHNILLTVVVAGIVATGVAYFLSGEKVTERVIERPVGAISGPEISSPFLSVNDVKKHYYSSSLVTATSSICMFRAQVNATTSLLGWYLRLDVATTVAYRITLASSTVQSATTTFIQSFDRAAGEVGALHFVPTTTAKSVFAPGTYLTVGMSGGLGQGLGAVPTGKCQAVFQEF